MADNLGPNQSRVLDPTNRSFESVVYQLLKPPLSCEANLDNSLSSDHAREVVTMVMPSGWETVGLIRDGAAESSCIAGDINTSSTYTANTLKLIALDKGVELGKLVAWVDGHRLLIQGTNSTDENNIIQLPVPPTISNRIDFVFLEVWRKLLGTTDTVYKYGNVLYGGINPDNDLVDPFVNIETSRRVQIQYRIRVAQSDLETYPDGFDPYMVYAQGPLSVPLSCSLAAFQPTSDPGLWRAGNGNSASQATLQTVDGYSYAIPICAIHRRNTGAYHPDTRSNGAGKTLAQYLTGYASDRPDSLYSDWVVGADILDMRHKVTPTVDMTEECTRSFDRLIRGQIQGRMVKSTLGEDHYGPVLTQADAVSYVDHAGSERIAQGDGVRRMFSNATMTQSRSLSVFSINQKYIGVNGTPWASGDTVRVQLTGYPTGTTVDSLQEVYSATGITIGYTVSTLPGNYLQVTINSGSILTTAYAVTLNYTMTYPSGPNGLTELPVKFYETRREDSTSSFAMTRDGIRARQTDPLVTNDGTKLDYLRNMGANLMEQYDFGHQMEHHVLGTGTQIIQFPRTINDYEILGVTSVKAGGTYRTGFTVQRTASLYQIDVGSPAIAINDDVELRLYTAGKFFQGNKQGRAIAETFEMKELTVLETPDGVSTSFHLDSTTHAILALGSNMNAGGYGIAYVNGVQKTLQTNNSQLPLDRTCARIQIGFSVSDTPAASAIVEVPVLLHSGIGSTEGYTFFYKTVPYQGVLDSTVTGSIEAVGPAITTTAGSGTIVDYSYSEGTASFVADSTVVSGVGTTWLSWVKPGYEIYAVGYSDQAVIVKEVYSDTVIFVNTYPEYGTGGAANYTVIGIDTPDDPPANVIDRLPQSDSDNDAMGLSEDISTAVSDVYPTLKTRAVSQPQDISYMRDGDFVAGLTSVDRGRAGVLTDGGYGPGYLGVKFEKLDSSSSYQKTYQSYILNKENTGRLYMMVVGTESGNSSHLRYFNENQPTDTVDLFELSGRPLVMRRPV